MGADQGVRRGTASQQRQRASRSRWRGRWSWSRWPSKGGALALQRRSAGPRFLSRRVGALAADRPGRRLESSRRLESDHDRNRAEGAGLGLHWRGLADSLLAICCAYRELRIHSEINMLGYFFVPAWNPETPLPSAAWCSVFWRQQEHRSPGSGASFPRTDAVQEAIR